MGDLRGQNILLVGGSGFVGRSLGLRLVREGAKVRVLTRRAAQARLGLPYPATLIEWDGVSVPAAALQGVDAVVNVAGESLVEGRWSAAKWQAIVDSRVGITKALAAAAAALGAWPKVLVQASAVGIYGERGEETLDDDAAPGVDRIAQLCVDWEAATRPFIDAKTRVAVMRLGVVLGLSGGALERLAAAHRPGIGAVVGPPKAWLSWIHIDDLTTLLATALSDERYVGAFNATAPEACRWREFSQELLGTKGPVLGLPPSLIRLALGEGPVAVSTSIHAVPAKARNFGFTFKYPTIAAALGHLLGPKDLRTAGYLYSEQFVPAPLAKVAAFFSDEKNLQELTPPWVNFQVLGKSTPEMQTNTLIHYRLKVKGVPINWTSRITVWDLPRRFVDEQVRGPYALWLHEHSFEELGNGTLMTDAVRYRVPLGKLGLIGGGWMVDRDVRKIFAYRRASVAKFFRD